MNQETVEVLRHPFDSMKKAWYAMKSDPVSAFKTLLTVPIKLPLRIAALVITGPIHGIAKLGSMAVSWWRNRNKSLAKDSTSDLGNEPVLVDKTHDEVNGPVLVKKASDLVDEPTLVCKATHPVNTRVVEVKRGNLDEATMLEDRNQQRLHSRLVAPKKIIIPALTDARIKAKIKKMDASFPSMKHAPDEIKAKRFHLEELSKLINGKSKYRSVEQIERYSQLISRHGLYRSHFRMKGSEVKELTEEVRAVAAPAA